MKILLSLLLFSILIVSCKQKNLLTSAKDQKIVSVNDSLTKKLGMAYSRDAIMGFSVSVLNEKGTLYNQGFGFTDIDQKKSYTENTTQNIGSISKTLIGIALLKAQELGKLNIEDPINKYLPFKIINPNHPETPILIKHLAYHTSSITDLDEVYAKSYVLAKETHADNEDVIDYFNKAETNISALSFFQNSLTQSGKWYKKETFSNSKPGEKREYSNIASALCALVIESATGQDYRDFTTDYILKPLKMKNSGWKSADVDETNRSRLFTNKKKMIAEYSLITYADGGFLTSTHDLSLFLSELINGYGGTGKLLGKESYRKLFEKQQFSENGKTEDHGIFIEHRNGFLKIKNEMIGHNGSDPGVFTAMYFNPTTKIGKIVFVNTDTDYSDKIWPEIIEIWKSLSEFEAKFSK